MFKKFYLKKVFIACIAIVITLFLVNQFIRKSFSPETELALFVDDIHDSIVVEDTFIVRNETVIRDDCDGVITYLVEDGQRVCQDGKIAEFYRNSVDVNRKEKILKINSQIESLRQLSSVTDLIDTSPTAIEKQISQKLKNLLAFLNERDYKMFRLNKEKLLYLMNERQVMTCQTSGFSSKIEELEKEKDSLESSGGEAVNSINSPVSGYFAKQIDGYETLVNYNLVSDLSLEDLEQIPKSVNKDGSNVIGKIISNQNWYIVMKVKSDMFSRFNQEDSLEIIMPSILSKKIPAKIHSLNQKDKNSDGIVVLKCDNINDEIVYVRREEVKVIFNSYSGIRVNKKAMHEKSVTKKVRDEHGIEQKMTKTIRGVYTVYAGELVFKEIVPLYIDANYIICNPRPMQENLFDGSTIKVYDQVVVGGRNLYDGKLIK